MVKKIDYEKWSKEELIKEIQRIKETTYGLVWHRDLPEEKIDVLINPDARTPSEMFPNEMAGKPFPVLKEVKSKAVETDAKKPVNILIEGDNYHSLAVLNFTHQEAIDVIYIDPPYNTGNNDFIYNDLQARVVQKDDPYRHSKWLAFMEKRLKLSKGLLKKTGVIFISIDDNEQAPLKMLCDEIFGEKNFIGMFKWNRVAKAPSLSYSMRTKYEYILAYYKETRIELFGKSSYNTQGPLWHLPNKRVQLNFPAGSLKVKQTFKKGDYGGSYKVELLDDIIEEGGFNKNDVRILAHSAWGQARINQYLKDGLTFEIKKTPATVYTTLNSEGNFIAPSDLITKEECGVETNTDASDALKAMGIPFDAPKPVSLIKYLANMATHDNKSAVILDFFAGSGTTGHAVLELNKEDGGNRKFILCTNNEELDNNGGKIKHRISTDICYPRVSKVIKGYKTTDGQKIDGLAGNLKYYTTAFVEAEPSDRNKRKLVDESTEMLCIKEAAFELVKEGKDFKIFKNTDKYLGIVFHEDAIDSYKEAIKKMDGHFNTYVFSLGDEPHEKEFADVKSKVTLCAIPEVILKVYREIFK